MDSLQRFNTHFYFKEYLLNFLKQNEAKYEKNAKFVELQITWVFVQFLERINKKEFLIGIPTLDNSVQNVTPTLDQMLDHKMALDEDFDLVIAPKEEAKRQIYMLQIVRFKGDIEGSTENLFRFLIEKKFNIPKDEHIILLVGIEKVMQLEYVELGQKFKNTNVPYGQIFIIGQKKPDDSLIFFCCQVYPDVIMLDDIKLGS